jgi:hypothetical protein
MLGEGYFFEWSGFAARIIQWLLHLASLVPIGSGLGGIKL